MDKKNILIVGSSGIGSRVSRLLTDKNILIRPFDSKDTKEALNMEPKIKSAKETKIKAIEQEQQIDESVGNDPEQKGWPNSWRNNKNQIQAGIANRTAKRRKANKVASKARKLNRKK